MLASVPLIGGFARRVAALLLPNPEAAEILDLALGLNAIFTQGLVTMNQPDDDAAAGSDATREPANRATDTCYMWRRGGPLEGLPVGKLTRP